jgi:LmbE family N-acetylglucosaminyl deacetylase
MDNILCISAHPDDIEIGMGGSINRYIAENKVVNVIICFYIDEHRKTETYNSTKILGLESQNVYFIDKKDNIREITKDVDKIVTQIRPNCIFTHFNGDSHQEHKIVSDIAIASTRNINCNLYMWENTFPGAITYNFFKPNFYVKLNTTNVEKKIDSFKEHKSQIQKYDSKKLCKFLKTKSEFWGFHCDSTNAEVFIQIKSVY